jgi:hypothetical protein
MRPEVISSGIVALDEVTQGLRLGDNVVWQVDTLEDYLYFVRPFVERSLKDCRSFVYLRFAPHPPLMEPDQRIKTIEVDPSKGFDAFCSEVQRIIQDEGKEVFYLFDNLSALVEEWATDELLANFFQVTCPHLFELDTVTYFALLRGQHANNAVARIRETTQLLIDVYHVQDQMYIHPLKVWNRYSTQMFLPHVVSGEKWTPLYHSGDAAAVSAKGRKNPLRPVGTTIAPWESVYDKLRQYPGAESEWPGAVREITALKLELTRMLLGNHPQFNRMADEFFSLSDLFHIRERVIGSGRIGGKAAGMLLARRILMHKPGEFDFNEVLEAHDSFFIGADVFFTFLVNNDLFRLRLRLSRSSDISHEEFEEVEKRFLTGTFPPEIMEQFRDMLDYFGQAPIIVRSSSLLEDSFGNAFAGKYRSEFCANQGDPDQRLEAFLSAVKLVYASALNPDALSYRRKRGLGDNDEQMAILVQRVSGMPYKKYFFPSLAGVAFSRNLYAWNDRINPKKGVVRLVFGLGTYAVDRVGCDYPRMIAVSHPELRPEVGARIAKYSQREAEILDLEKNDLSIVPIPKIIQNIDYPNMHLFVSMMKDGYIQDPISSYIDGPAHHLVMTFNNLINKTPFVKIIGEMLERIEQAYGHPVDTEFTASIRPDGRVGINLLQCRPLWLPGAIGPVTLPESVPEERILFKSNRIISGGVVSDIRYLVYIDPRAYSGIEDPSLKKSIGRVVGRINQHEATGEGKLILMGPGRWGSSNIDLGVNASYADIDNAAILVEIAQEEAGHVPEVSYGTHFFQDLVEAQITYLPVFPMDPGTAFNHDFFHNSENVIEELLPGDGLYKDIVKVIDVPRASGGFFAQVVADAQKQEAICYLEQPGGKE